MACCPELGLVCITHSEEGRFRRVTRKRLLTLAPRERHRVLEELYAHNVERLRAMLEFCARKRIRLYRLTSALFPFADHEMGRGVLGAFRRPLAEAGGRAAELEIRLVVHPDQFVVLNSESPAVAASSAAMLRGQGRVLDLLGQPRSPWAAITIHGGKSGRGRELVRAVRRLPASVRSRLVLENDERCYGADEIIAICREARVPMVFDAHHHAVHERLSTYEDPSTTLHTRAAAGTWPDPGWQIVHISNGRDSFRDPTHSDYIRAVPSAFLDVPWIEVEAKAKERAIARLRAAKVFTSRCEGPGRAPGAEPPKRPPGLPSACPGAPHRSARRGRSAPPG